MKKTNQRRLVIGSAVLWAAAILASALVLRGTEHAQEVFFILMVLAVASLMLVQNVTGSDGADHDSPAGD